MSVPPLVYTAMSKHMFYCRDVVCEYVLRAGAVPLNPFRMFDYFLGDRVERDVIRNANARTLMAADEMWVFGTELADGVFEEIRLAKQWGTPLRYFSVGSVVDEIKPVEVAELTFEPEFLAAVDGDDRYLRGVLAR